MAETELKRNITQAELDAAYAALERRATSSPVTPGGAPAPAAASPGKHMSFLGGGTDAIGLHLGEDRTVVALVTRKNQLEKHGVLQCGFGNLDRLHNELSLWLSAEKIGKKMPVYVTLSGRPAHFVVTRIPKLTRPLMLKALKLQLKQVSGEDRDDLSFLALPTPMKIRETHAEYLAACIEKERMEKISQLLRKMKLRVQAWDLDFLCYTRVATYLWQKNGIGDSTRFLVLLEWDHCHLLVLSADGKLVAQRLSIGVQSFLQQLKAAREGGGAPAGEEKSWHQLTADPMDVRQRRVMANQAIHDVYVPLSQQIKAQLFAGCSDSGISLPTHFAILGPGSESFGLLASLSADLGLKPVDVTATLPSETLAAFGAALWEKQEMRFNFLPRGKKEWMKALSETVKDVRSRLSPGLAKSSNMAPPGQVKMISAGALVVALIVGYPAMQRMKVEREVAAAHAKLDGMTKEKDRIQKCKDREGSFDKKISMVKEIEKKRLQLSGPIRELIGVLPAEIKLQTLALKDNTFNLKGLSRSETAIEKFLKAAMSLKDLLDPTPVGITRDKEGTTFELTFRLRAG